MSHLLKQKLIVINTLSAVTWMKTICNVDNRGEIKGNVDKGEK